MWIPEGKAIPHVIAGELVDGQQRGEGWENRNPVGQRRIGTVSAAGADLCRQAVGISQQGFKEWSTLSAADRALALRALADILHDNRADVAHWEAKDTGRPIREILSYDVPSAVECLRYHASLLETTATQFHRHAGSFGYVERVPYGVCVGIGAWNYPLQVFAWKLAPALAMGNTMVFKPSEWTPVSAVMLASLAIEAGIPPSVVQVVHGAATTGDHLVRDHRVRKVSLTGSVPTGKKVAEICGASLKAVTMELGGKSGLLVCRDAPLQESVDIALMANFYSNGQVCTNGTRVYVDRAMYADFLELLVSKTRAIAIGDPLDESCEMGPLIHPNHLDRVIAFVEGAKRSGARHLCGGERPPFSLDVDHRLGNSPYLTPAIFADADESMEFVQSEIFGPVMAVLAIENESEAVERINRFPYGLAAGVVTSDLARGQRICAELDAGVCWLNTYNETPISMPFGGLKDSGIGRENGTFGIECYSQVKSTIVATGPFAPGFGSSV